MGEKLEGLTRSGTLRVSGNLAQYDRLGNLEKVLDKSCKLCSHVKVCSIYRAVKPLLGNWEEQDRPFEAEEIAKVCKEFKLAVNTT